MSNEEDEIHSRRFVEGKHLDRWLSGKNKWLEWGTERAPALFRRPTFPELYDVTEKILIHRTAGEYLRSCYDAEGTLCNHTVILCIPWYLLRGVRNRSIKKSARYYGEKPIRHDLLKREECEAISQRISSKYLLGILNSTIAREFLRSNRRSNTDLYPDDWKKLPIPDIPVDEQQPIVGLVNRILDAKRADPNANISRWETDIDGKVEVLYNK